MTSQWANTPLLHISCRAPELCWGSYVSGRWTSSQYVQCMECIKPPGWGKHFFWLTRLTWLLVPGYCPLNQPWMLSGSSSGQIWQRFSLACFVYRSQCIIASSEPMKENISGYSRNPCSLNREWDAAFAAISSRVDKGLFSREIWGADGAFASIRIAT